MATEARAPRGLKAGGRKLWREVASIYDLRPDELATLEQACRAADLVDRLATELEGQELIVPGSKGQATANPLVSELRLQRRALDGLLRSLQLVDADSPTAHRARNRDRQGRFRSNIGLLPPLRGVE